jgi:hypothetical protein
MTENLEPIVFAYQDELTKPCIDDDLVRATRLKLPVLAVILVITDLG